MFAERFIESLSAFVFIGWGSLAKMRETERHVPKEITNISTRVFLNLLLTSSGEDAWGKHAV